MEHVQGNYLKAKEKIRQLKKKRKKDNIQSKKSSTKRHDTS